MQEEFMRRKKHRIQNNAGIHANNTEVSNTKSEPEIKENICKVCPIPHKFSTQKILKQDMLKKHEGTNDVVKAGKFTRCLSEQEVSDQELKQVGCDLCENLFTCQQNLDQHKESVYGINHFFKCNICPKTFMKRKPLADHIREVHRTPKIVCPECGKK